MLLYLDELWIRWNNMWKKFQVYNHDSEAYGVFVLFYKGIIIVWESVVYPKEESMEWHNRACLYGKCRHYGVDRKLSFCLIELASTRFNLVEWKQFALEETRSKSGRLLEKMTFVYKKTTSNEMIDYLKPKLQHFVKHNFMVCWEDK